MQMKINSKVNLMTSVLSNLLDRLNEVAEKLESLLVQIRVLENTIPQRKAQIIELTNPKRPRLREVKDLLTAAQFLSIRRTPQTLFPEQVEFLNELNELRVRLLQNENTIREHLKEVYYHIPLVEIRIELSSLWSVTPLVNYVREVDDITEQIEIELREISKTLLGV